MRPFQYRIRSMGGAGDSARRFRPSRESAKRDDVLGKDRKSGDRISAPEVTDVYGSTKLPIGLEITGSSQMDPDRLTVCITKSTRKERCIRSQAEAELPASALGLHK